MKFTGETHTGRLPVIRRRVRRTNRRQLSLSANLQRVLAGKGKTALRIVDVRISESLAMDVAREVRKFLDCQQTP